MSQRLERADRVCNAVLAAVELHDQSPPSGISPAPILHSVVSFRGLNFPSCLLPAPYNRPCLLLRAALSSPLQTWVSAQFFDMQAFQDAPEPQDLWIAVQQAAQAQGEVSAVNVQRASPGTRVVCCLSSFMHGLQTTTYLPSSFPFIIAIIAAAIA